MSTAIEPAAADQLCITRNIIVKTLFQKSDLDTCLTSLIHNISPVDQIIHTRGEASAEDLSNPGVLCIECGGSGLTHLGNFDHHNDGRHLPPACRQAFDANKCRDSGMARLVEYVCLVDEGVAIVPPIAFPSLSNFFSGMLLVEQGSEQSFVAGIRLLKTFLETGFDPFMTVPRLDAWAHYLQAKENNMQQLRTALSRIQTFRTRKGLMVGVLVTTAIGGLSAMYARVDIAILFNSHFGDPPVPKFTIASRNMEIYGLTGALAHMEPGWGGRQNIIGSPRSGSQLDIESVARIVADNM